MLKKVLGCLETHALEIVALVVICATVAFVSPIRLSPDSAIYLHAAVTKVDLYHPHHLLFAAVLRGLAQLQELLGLGGETVPTYRRAMLILSFSALAGVWLFLTSQKLSIYQRIFALLAIGLSSTWLQYSTLIESAVPAVGTLCFAAAILQEVVSDAADKNRSPQASQPAGFILASIAFVISYAMAVCFHQSAVLAAIPFLVMGISVNFRSRALRSLLVPFALLAASAAVVALFYVLAHRSVGQDLPFGVWVTKYAHYQGQGWGPSANVSIEGLIRWTRSLGIMFHNPYPWEFYGGGPFSPYSVGLGWGMLAWGIVVVAGLLREKERRVENMWLIVWLLIFEGFIFAWSHRPYYHLLAFPAYLVLSCRFVEHLPPRWKQLLACLLIGMILAVGSANVVTMRRARISEPSACGLGVEAMRAWIREGDTVVAAWHERLFLEALGCKARCYPVSQAPRVVPRWDQGERGRLILAKSVAILAGNPPAEAEKHFSTSIRPFLDQLLAIHKTSPLRGALIRLASSPHEVGVVFGVDNELPLPLEQVLAQFSESLRKEPQIAKGVLHGWLEAARQAHKGTAESR